ncbi:hypothetical protein [Rhodococcus triatomae]|nr:ErfK/YbiS/YcfS/YnhG family lipoprotein [Rhodococcus triatomae BKS 15-14]
MGLRARSVIQNSSPDRSGRRRGTARLNLSPDNAQWFFGFSVPGDVVEVRNTGGAPLEVWQNGDWSLTWHQWLAGSAL